MTEYQPRTSGRLIELLLAQDENPRSWQHEAAARITELEAERDRIADELDASNNNHRAMAHQMAELGARCKHAESELSRVEDRCANMRILLVRVRQLGMTAAWKRLPDGSPFSSIPLFGDIEAALDSLPPLAKRGEQKSCERRNPPAEQSTTVPQQLTEN